MFPKLLILFASQILLFGVSVGMLSASTKSDSDQKDYEKKPNVSLKLKLDKAKYKKDQYIEITVYLENLSSTQSVYVGKELGGLFTILSHHYIELSIKDARGKEVPILKSASAESVSRKAVADILDNHYFLLQPGAIYGLKRHENFSLKPGVYKFQATYKEMEAFRWKKTEIPLLSSPILMNSVLSNEVTIKIY